VIDLVQQIEGVAGRYGHAARLSHAVDPHSLRATVDQKFLMTEPFGSILKCISCRVMSASDRTSRFG
jgi:hypothetical protein